MAHYKRPEQTEYVGSPNRRGVYINIYLCIYMQPVKTKSIYAHRLHSCSFLWLKLGSYKVILKRNYYGAYEQIRIKPDPHLIVFQNYTQGMSKPASPTTTKACVRVALRPHPRRGAAPRRKEERWLALELHKGKRLFRDSRASILVHWQHQRGVFDLVPQLHFLEGVLIAFVCCSHYLYISSCSYLKMVLASYIKCANTTESTESS